MAGEAKALMVNSPILAATSSAAAPKHATRRAIPPLERNLISPPLVSTQHHALARMDDDHLAFG
jgi:hypothetical protein